MKTQRILQRILIAIASATIVLALAACAAPTPAATPTEAPVVTEAPTAAPTEAPVATAAPTEAAKPFKVAVVAPSAKNDLAFSQSMYDALVKIQKDMGGEDKFQFAFSENMFNVDDALTAIRDYASQGYDLVIAHGSQYGSGVAEIAPDFPKTAFAWGTTVDTFKDKGITNVFAYEARSEEGGYVLGVMAAKLSKSHIIGEIGPIETGDAKLYVDGFKEGVLATDATANVQTVYTSSFSDTTKFADAATTQMAAGADVLTGSSQAVTGAIGVAKDKNVLWFGTQSDQSSLAPNIVVASQVYDWTVVLTEIIAKVKAGTLGGEAYGIKLSNSGLKIAYNTAYSLPDDVKKAAEDAIKGISDGTIKIKASSASK